MRASRYALYGAKLWIGKDINGEELLNSRRSALLALDSSLTAHQYFAH